MKTKEIIAEYTNRKNRIKALSEELKYLEKAPEFVKVTHYGEELTKSHIDIEDVHIRILDKKRNLEMQIAIDQGFTAKINMALASLKLRIGAREYEVFDLRHLKERNLDYIAIKCGYAYPSSIHKKLKKQEAMFEKMLNVDEGPS